MAIDADEERKCTNIWDDDPESDWKSWLVPIVVATSVVMFIVTMYTNNCPSHQHGTKCVLRFLGKFSFEPLRRNPLFGPTPHTLLKMGAVNFATVVHHRQGWRLFTSIWLHTGFVHLFVNVLSLLFVGIRLEQQFGFARITALYVLAGLGGNIVSCLLSEKHVTVGASAALIGLIGAMYGELLTNWTIYTNKITAVFTLLIMLTINVAIAIGPYRGNFGQVIGGFLSGFLLGLALLARPHVGWFTKDNLPCCTCKTKFKPYQYVLGVIAVVLLSIGYIIGLLILFRGIKGHHSVEIGI